ncbi:MAG: methyl-accepting chemotaxis protein [Solirubrobacteraceae bacterium]|nr:methyl-accepting chemotaxis protein [Solirubrobacteraceae bacterium]
MSRFNDLRLASRLGLAFGVVILAVLAIAAISIARIGTLNAAAGELSDRDMVSLERVLNVQRRVQRGSALIVTHLYVFDGDLRAQDGIAAQITTLAKENVADMTALDAELSDPSARPLLARFKAARARYAAAHNVVIPRSRAETVAGAVDRSGSRDAYLEQMVPADAAVTATGAALNREVNREVAAARRQTDATAAGARRTIVVAALLALLAAIALALVVVRSVVRPLRVVVERLVQMRDVCIAGLHAGVEAMAKGDLTRDVVPRTALIERPAGDEVGDVARAFNEIRERTAATIAAYNATRAQLGGLVGGVSSSAQTLSAASAQMATTSEEAGRAVGEIATAVGEVAQGAERQVRAVEQARLASEEVATASGVSARTAQETAEAAVSARAIAEQGAGAVAQASEAMAAVRDSSLHATEAIRELGAKSGQIEGIVATITGIAEQTNLLALNAAIEAARAGEQGRGFAVVAEEVRKLAEGSKSAAASIAGLVGEIQGETARAVEVVEDGARRTEEGVATVDQARESFLALGEAVQDMNGRVEQIAAAIQRIASSSQQVQSDMSEVAAVAEQSSASSEQVSASTQQTSASTQQIAASAQELARTAEELERLVGQFTLATR